MGSGGGPGSDRDPAGPTNTPQAAQAAMPGLFASQVPDASRRRSDGGRGAFPVPARRAGSPGARVQRVAPGGVRAGGGQSPERSDARDDSTPAGRHAATMCVAWMRHPSRKAGSRGVLASLPPVWRT
jgi:hypothetical protein